MAHAYNNLGVIAIRQGDLASAREHIEEALVHRRALGDQLGIASCLHNLGEITLQQGDHERARSTLRESLTLKWELGERYYLASTLEALARLAWETGHAEPGARLLAASQALREAMGTPIPQDEAQTLEKLRSELESGLGDRFSTHWNRGREQSLSELLAEAHQDWDRTSS